MDTGAAWAKPGTGPFSNGSHGKKEAFALKKEKSCGAVVYRKGETGMEVLLIKHKNGGHWAFPKGHVEKKETESAA